MAQVKLGDAKALDSGLVALDHPDGDAGAPLRADRRALHLAAVPVPGEGARRAHRRQVSYNYFGAHTFLVTVMTQKFYDEHTAFAKFFYNDGRGDAER